MIAPINQQPQEFQESILTLRNYGYIAIASSLLGGVAVYILKSSYFPFEPLSRLENVSILTGAIFISIWNLSFCKHVDMLVHSGDALWVGGAGIATLSLTAIGLIEVKILSFLGLNHSFSDSFSLIYEGNIPLFLTSAVTLAAIDKLIKVLVAAIFDPLLDPYRAQAELNQRPRWS